MDDATLGAMIRLTREKAGESARAVALGIGMDPSNYAKSEGGKRAFKATELVAVADYLDRPLDDLIQRTDAADVAALRRAQQAGEVAVGAITDWVATAGRSMLPIFDNPDGLAVALQGEGRAEMLQRITQFVEATLPRPRVVAVPPGTRALFEAALRTVVPGRIQITEAVSGAGADPQ